MARTTATRSLAPALGIALVVGIGMSHACVRARVSEGEGGWSGWAGDVRVVALTHVRLIAGTGAPAVEDQTILIAGDRIGSVGPYSEIVIPAGADVRDLRGHTVIPGFVQLHEHTWFGGIAEPVHADWSAELYLRNGVTTANGSDPVP